MSLCRFPLQKAESDLIVMATLLTKAANLGGLTRSSEVFGVKAVALDNLKHLKQNEFTSIRCIQQVKMK